MRKITHQVAFRYAKDKAKTPEGAKQMFKRYLTLHPNTKKRVTDFLEKGKEKTKEVGKQVGGAVKEKVNKFVQGSKDLTQAGKEKLQKLPQGMKQFVADKEFRKEVTQKAAGTIKESPKKVGTKLFDHFKHEVHEVKGGMKKVFKGQKPNKAELKAIGGMAVEIAAAALSIGTAGAAGAGFVLGKSMAKHIALGAIHITLGDVYIMYESSHVLGHLLHFAAEEPTEEEMTNALVNYSLSSLVKKLEQGLSDQDMVDFLNGEEEELVPEKKQNKSSTEVIPMHRRVAKRYMQKLQKKAVFEPEMFLSPRVQNFEVFKDWAEDVKDYAQDPEVSKMVDLAKREADVKQGDPRPGRTRAGIAMSNLIRKLKSMVMEGFANRNLQRHLSHYLSSPNFKTLFVNPQVRLSSSNDPRKRR